MVEARAMSWPEFKAFNKFRREHLYALKKQYPDADDDFINESIGEESVDWVLKNIYPDLDLSTIGPIEAMVLSNETTALTKKQKDAEAKN